MKNFMIILLSVFILALTGCGKAGDNKNKDVVSDNNSAENVSTEAKVTDYTDAGKENQATNENEGSETATAANQAQISKEESEGTTAVKTEQTTGELSQVDKTTDMETQSHKEQQTEQAEGQTVKEPDSVATDIKYDIDSLEYQNEVKRLTIYYINQYRES